MVRGFLVVGGLVLLAVYMLDSRGKEPTAEPGAALAATQPSAIVRAEPEPVDPETTARRRVIASKTLDAAIANALPFMEDTMNDDSSGATMLAVWSSVRGLSLGDIENLPATKRGLVMKDSAIERGKRLCISGYIIEIEATRTDAGTIYDGGILSGHEVTRFIAVGSTGNLVGGSRARFCGVVTGRSSYSNSGGGVEPRASS